VNKPDLGTVEPKTVRDAERRETSERGGNGIGSVLKAIEKNLPDALIEAKERKARLVMELAAVCAEITRIDLHIAVSVAEAAPPESQP
jgi:hypothetical protein